MRGELRDKPLDRGLLDAFVELTLGTVVLDVGCGPGHVTAALAARGAIAIGCDLSPQMCALARDDTSLPFCSATMTALPVAAGGSGGIVCLYAVMHLDSAHRDAAYREFARALRSGGVALIAFHARDAEFRSGGIKTITEWWGHEVALTFRFLEPEAEVRALKMAGFELLARLDRAPHPDVEYPSQRSYLLVRRA